MKAATTRWVSGLITKSAKSKVREESLSEEHATHVSPDNATTSFSYSPLLYNFSPFYAISLSLSLSLYSYMAKNY